MNTDWTKWKIEIKERPRMNSNHPTFTFSHGISGKPLDIKPLQNPDEFFSGPAIIVSGWVPLQMADGSVRIAFCEQVFTDGKQHFRTAVVIPKNAFNAFVETLVNFQKSQTTTSLQEVKHGNA
jgi:hypothetical protein